MEDNLINLKNNVQRKRLQLVMQQWSIWSCCCRETRPGLLHVPWSQREPGTGGCPAPFQVGGAGAHTPRHSCSHPEVGVDPWVYPCKLESACSGCLVSPCSQCTFESQSIVEAEPRHCHTQLGVHALWVALTHQDSAASAPSGLWALMSMGWRPRRG